MIRVYKIVVNTDDKAIRVSELRDDSPFIFYETVSEMETTSIFDYGVEGQIQAILGEEVHRIFLELAEVVKR